MNWDEKLAVVRRAYAKQIMAAFGVADRRVEAASRAKVAATPHWRSRSRWRSQTEEGER